MVPEIGVSSEIQHKTAQLYSGRSVKRFRQERCLPDLTNNVVAKRDLTRLKKRATNTPLFTGVNILTLSSSYVKKKSCYLTEKKLQ